MKALAAPGYGPLDRVALVEAPLREPRSGEVRVRVAASALNPADYKVILGTLKIVQPPRRGRRPQECDAPSVQPSGRLVGGGGGPPGLFVPGAPLDDLARFVFDGETLSEGLGPGLRRLREQSHRTEPEGTNAPLPVRGAPSHLAHGQRPAHRALRIHRGLLQSPALSNRPASTVVTREGQSPSRVRIQAPGSRASMSLAG